MNNLQKFAKKKEDKKELVSRLKGAFKAAAEEGDKVLKKADDDKKPEKGSEKDKEANASALATLALLGGAGYMGHGRGKELHREGEKAPKWGVGKYLLSALLPPVGAYQIGKSIGHSAESDRKAQMNDAIALRAALEASKEKNAWVAAAKESGKALLKGGDKLLRRLGRGSARTLRKVDKNKKLVRGDLRGKNVQRAYGAGTALAGGLAAKKLVSSDD